LKGGSMDAKLFHKERAQGMVEFALVLPLLLLVMFAVIEFGRLLFIYSAVFTASREAARYGAAVGDVGNSVPHYQDCAGITAAARRITNLAGLNTITISYDDGNGNSLGTCPSGAANVGLGDRVIVDVSATYQPILPLVHIPAFPISSQTARTVLKDISVSGTPSAPTGTVSVFFETDHSSASESAGEVVLRVRLSALYREDVWIPFSVTGGTATPGADYTVDTLSPLLIRSGATLAEIHIRINQDALDEDDETVALTLGNPVNANLGNPATHTLTINDDDLPPSVTFTTASQGITEPSQGSSTTAQVTLQLSAVSGRNVSVPFSSNPAQTTATAGIDYAFDTGSPVVIPAGQLTGHINVRVIGDNLDEDDETVQVRMGTPVNATRGLLTAHTVTILDDDLPPFVHFTWERQEVTEDVGNVGIQVQLSAPSGRTVTVPYSLGGTATQFDDYTIAESPLVIPPGATQVDIPATVYLDTLDETDETVTVSMGTPVNAFLGQPSVHTLVIKPYVSPPQVFFDPMFQEASEAAGNTTVLVRLSHAYYLDVTVPFVIEGTARQGVDYQITPSPVVIPAGSASVPVQITIMNDLIDEIDESVKLTMGTPANATLGNPYVHETVIQDDDNPPSVYFTSPGQSGNEAVGSMLVTVRLSNISGKDVLVPFSVGGSATLGSDYSLSPTALVTIPAGYQERTIDISVVNDDASDGVTNVGEPAETIILSIGTPVNAVAGTTYNTHTATITAWVCPTAPNNPYFESSNSVGLVWQFNNAGIGSVNLMQVRIIWPTQGNTRLMGIGFPSMIGAGSYYPDHSGDLTVNTPHPLWSGAFTSQQMVFLFSSHTDRRPITVTARFEHCLPLSGSLSQ
jgi:Flp pilus assembly protein TadG